MKSHRGEQEAPCKIEFDRWHQTRIFLWMRMCGCKFSWNTDRSFPPPAWGGGGFISLSVYATIGSGQPNYGGWTYSRRGNTWSEDSCLCADDVEPDIVTSGGPHLDAPCPNPWWGRRRRKKVTSTLKNRGFQLF